AQLASGGNVRRRVLRDWSSVNLPVDPMRMRIWPNSRDGKGLRLRTGNIHRRDRWKCVVYAAHRLVQRDDVRLLTDFAEVIRRIAHAAVELGTVPAGSVIMRALKQPHRGRVSGRS